MSLKQLCHKLKLLNRFNYTSWRSKDDLSLSDICRTTSSKIKYWQNKQKFCDKSL